MKPLFTLFSILCVVLNAFSQSPGCPQINPVGGSVCQGQCRNLSATAITNNQTTSYAVSAIGYSPFPYSGGTGVSVGTDDVWSSAVNLGFDFCFYGTSYNQVILGSNGQICFNTASAGGYDSYPVTTAGALPSTANTPGNTINVFRDIDPSVSGANVSYYIAGSAPCRYLVFYFSNVALFSCGTPRSTFQMVLYENTNYIDIYIANSSGSCSWQNGYGIVGIQNAAATSAVVAPGRNANSGAWTATNEAWRFTPTGAPSYAVTWYGPGNAVVGTGLGPVSVCPTTNTTYTASMAITNCDGAITTYTNTALVTVNNSPTVTIAPTGTLNCSGTTPITTTVTPASTYNWSGPGVVSGGTTGTANVNLPGVYTVSATALGCTRTATINMVSPPPITITANSPNICQGGTAVLTGAGASTYTWSTGSSTNPQNVSPASLTTYTVTGTSASGCTGTAISTVGINPSPSAVLSFTNPSCGSSNGIINITNTSSGGQTISSFGSSMGSISGQTVTGLGSGTPVITLTNNFGCTFTVSTTLTTGTGPSNITATPTNESCTQANGSIAFGSPVGGTTPYTYSFNGGAFTAVSPITGLSAGTYSITVKDGGGCTYTKTVAITNSPGPTAITGTTTPAGCGLTNGTHNITGITSGTAAYTFSINGVSTPSLSSNLAPGNYSVTVRDANGCTFTKTVTIGGTTGPTSATIVTTNATCGTANGTATVTGVTGGAPAYSYSFDGGTFAAGTTTTGLTVGGHNVTIKDANTCTLTVPYTVLNTGSPLLSLTGSVNLLCNGGTTGSFTVTATGGSGSPYTYTLTSPFQTNGNGQFTNLAAGTYTVNAKDVAGCITSITVTLTQPTAVTLTPTSIPAKCYGASTGTVNVSGSGGVGPYQYQINGTGYQTSNSFTTVAAGTHIIQIKDANGCTATQTITVTQPTALALLLASQNANCIAANGVATSTVSGGTLPYIYNWTGGGGAAPTTNSVVSGSYSLTVTDGNNCTISGVALIGNTPGGTAAITGSTNITCNNSNNGSLTGNMASGGTAPYTYSWSPGGQNTSTAINLAPGTYTCKITDYYGCIATAVGTLTQPTALTSLMNSNNVKCFGTATGTVSASGSGGTGPYNYLWSPLSSTLTTVNNVAIGIYTCQITDANNCVINPTIAVTQPSSITITSTVTPANCGLSNGSATITPSGGTPAYSYTWSAGSNTTVQTSIGAGTYTINVKDANNCTYTVAATVPNLTGPSISITSFTNVSCFGGNNGGATSAGTGGTGALTYLWNTGQNTPTATNFLNGVHTVTVTDASGCVASTSVSITQPVALSVSITPVNPKCFGATNGYGAGSAFGGTPTYSYSWSGTGGTNPTSNPVGAGNYALNVSDAHGCVATASMALVNPPAMSASITSTNITCFNTCNGTAIGSATNNTGVVTYYWIGGPSPVTSQTLSSLCAGSYTLTATDQNTCSASAQVIITQPTQLTANISSTGSVTCNGGTNGFAQVTAGGGTGTYTYAWTGVAAAAGNSANTTNLPAGTYTVTLTDQNNCSATTQTTISQPSPLATTLTTTNPKCNGSTDGIASVAFSGGAGATTFLWYPGLQTGNTVNNLAAGNHTVTITSNGSCTTSLTFTLTQPAVLTTIVTSTNSNCGQSNGATSASVGGGTTPYNYLWSNGPTVLSNPGILAGGYTFTVTDNNLCKATAAGLVNDIAGPSVAITSTTAVKCFNGNDGAATSTITGGVMPYTIGWNNNSATTPNVSNFIASASPYIITVTDAANCVGTASLIITQPSQLNTAISSHTDVTCNGLSNGQAVMTVSGGTAAYSYSWTPSAQTSSVMVNVGANTYTCYVKDANNCPGTQVVTISQPLPLIMSASSSSNISCFGGTNGQISTTVQGGTPGYVYTWSPAQTNAGVLGGLSSGNYSLTITDTKTCSINANFTILEPSALTSTYTSSPAKCGVANGSGTVTVNGGTPSYTLNWNNTGLQQGPVGTGMGPGTTNCVITDSKGCSITQAVVIGNALSPVISSITTQSPTCFGKLDGSITVNYSQGTPNYTVSWTNPINPASQTTSGLSQTVTGVGAGSYGVTITDSYGCSTGGFPTVGQPQQLVIIPTPAQTICFGQSAQISATGTGGTTPYTYTWTPAQAGASPYTVNPTTTTLYNVNMTDANNCVTSPVVVTVNVTPALSMNGFAVTKCHGDGVALSPTINSPGRGATTYTYTWSNGVVDAAPTSTLNVTANYPTNPNQYTVTLNDGCTSPMATATFTINVNPLPVITFTANPKAGCVPLVVTLTGVSNGVSDVFTWQDNVQPLGTGNPFVYTFADSGKYSISLHVQNPLTGCSSDSTKKDYINVYPKPIAEFIPNPQTASILDPFFNFTNTSQGAVSYLWDFGDPAASAGSNNAISINSSHYYSYVGTYNVNLVATSSHGCTAVALHSVEVTPDFALYIPNTFTPDANSLNDFFQPAGVGINEDNYRMDIFDRWGENIFTSNNFRKGWDGSVKGGKTAEQGVYVYKLMVYDIQGNKHPFVGHVTVIKMD